MEIAGSGTWEREGATELRGQLRAQMEFGHEGNWGGRQPWLDVVGLQLRRPEEL
jgi:hypothetical protein